MFDTLKEKFVLVTSLVPVGERSLALEILGLGHRTLDSRQPVSLKCQSHNDSRLS